GKFQQTGSLAAGRGWHAAVLLPDGRVAIFGGGDTRVEIYDPATGQFTVHGKLVEADYLPGCNAFLRPDGKVFITGNKQLAVELYDPATGESAKVGALGVMHPAGSVLPLPGGQLLLAGGWGTKDALKDAE